MDAPSEIVEHGSSDDDDRRIFWSWRYQNIASGILRIKRNDPHFTELWLTGVYDLHERAWARLGHILGHASYVKTVYINSRQVNVVEFCLGLQPNKSIKDFTMSGVNFGGDLFSSLSSFLRNNPSLTRLSLEFCQLEPAHINLLSSILLQREATLEYLNLKGNRLGDINLERFVLALSRNRNMADLDLSHTGIGPRGCISIANLLARPECTLQQLDLFGNSIDYQATIFLADSLATNTMLKRLNLNGNDTISTAGWRAMLKLVCNSSSIETIMSSNHMLSSVWLACFPGMFAVHLGYDDANLLCESLRVNENDNKNMAVRKKILWSHARGDVNIGDSPVPISSIPMILEWIGDNLIQYHNPPLPQAIVDTMRLGSIYRILQSRPDTCCGIKSDSNKKRKLHSI